MPDTGNEARRPLSKNASTAGMPGINPARNYRDRDKTDLAAQYPAPRRTGNDKQHPGSRLKQ